MMGMAFQIGCLTQCAIVQHRRTKNMSTNKLIVQGFGTGAVYGTPTTIGLAPTSTLSITSSLVGMYHLTGLVTGVSLTLVSTANAVTGTYTILSGPPGHAFLHGPSALLVRRT